MRRRSTTAVFGWTLLLLVGMLFASGSGIAGCTSKAEADKPEHLLVFFSNETNNELYPGGRSNSQGGMSRRATLFGQQQEYPELIVDTGGFSARRPDNSYDLYKQEYLLRIYDMLGYHALNAGVQEFMIGRQRLQALNDATGGLMVSANIVDESGVRVLPAYRIVHIGKIRVGIAGLIGSHVTPKTEPPSEALSTRDPLQAFAEVWPDLLASSDLQVVLSQLGDNDVDELTKRFPELDLVVGGPKWSVVKEMEPTAINGVVYGKVGMRGKYVGQVHLELEPDAEKQMEVVEFDGTAIALTREFADNPRIDDILQEFKERLRTGQAKTADGTRIDHDVYDPGTEGAQYKYSGSVNCMRCHSAIYGGWLKTSHSKSFQSLQEKGEETNPACLQCHTVGYGQEGGYRDKSNTYLLGTVQCESCHGPASDHANLATNWKEGRLKEKPSDWLIEQVDVPESTCVQCHDADNDPHWSDDEPGWPYERLRAQIECSQWMTGTPPGQAPSVHH